MRPGFLDSFTPARNYATSSPFVGVAVSFEYGEVWPDTLPDPDYPSTFAGFSTPSAITPLESFELAGSWPGTLADPAYPSSFTGFTSPSDTTPLESFEVADNWPVDPPSPGNLLVWLDANDITQADGVSVPTMPNKGSLGGTWSTTNAQGTVLAPLAATIGGRRILSLPGNWSGFNGASVPPNYGYNVSSFNFPATTAATGITLVILAQQDVAWNNSTGVPPIYLGKVGSSTVASGLYFGGAYGGSSPPFGTFNWSPSTPSQNASSGAWAFTASQFPGEFAAYGTQLSTTLPNNQSAFILRKNAGDLVGNATFSATGTVGVTAGGVEIGGYNQSFQQYNWKGYIREVLAWNTLVSTADIRAWLDAKYGSTW